MQNLWDFLSMGGYGAYVWPAYGITGLILGAVAAWAGARYRAQRAALRALEKSPDRNRDSAPPARS